MTALLSSIGASRTAKRAAVIHLLFNVVGAVIFGIVMFVLFSADAAWAQRTISSVEISDVYKRQRLSCCSSTTFWSG